MPKVSTPVVVEFPLLSTDRDFSEAASALQKVSTLMASSYPPRSAAKAALRILRKRGTNHRHMNQGLRRAMTTTPTTLPFNSVTTSAR